MGAITLDELTYVIRDYPGTADTMSSGFTDIEDIGSNKLRLISTSTPSVEKFSRRKMLAKIKQYHSCVSQYELDEESYVIYEQIKALTKPIDEQKCTLGFLLSILTDLNSPTTQCRYGFSSPHSWYVDGKDIAFEPTKNATVGQMINDINYVIKPTTKFIDRRYNTRTYTINSSAHIGYSNCMCSDEMMDNLINELYLLVTAN